MNFLTQLQLDNLEKKNLWFEKFVNLKEKDNIFFFEKKINIKKN